MAGFDGSGNFTRFYSWMADAAAGTKIRADRHDDEDNGFANGLSQCITKTGVSVISADIPWNGKKIVNLANGVNPTDAVNKAQLDALRSFSTAVIISGSTPESRLRYTGATGPWGDSYVTADLAFGAAAAGTSWVWNDKADFTGTDVMALADIGTLTLQSVDPGAGIGPTLSLYRNSASPAASDGLGYIAFSGKNSAAALKTYGQIYVTLTDPTSGAEDSNIIFTQMTAGTVTPRLNINNAGANVTGNFTVSGGVTSGQNFVSSVSTAVLASTGAGAVYLRPVGAGNTTGQAALDSAGGLTLSGGFIAGAAGSCRLGQGFVMKTGANGTFGGSVMNLYWNGTNQLGYTDATYTGYMNAPSDARIKKDIKPLDSTWENVKALAPISYTPAQWPPAERLKEGEKPVFVESDELRWGFIAQQLRTALLPSAAFGEEDGDVLMSPQLLPIIAALTKALQEAMARIEALEARAPA
jgi:endosialidase-like protein/trimeric autotransporter adhesin